MVQRRRSRRSGAGRRGRRQSSQSTHLTAPPGLPKPTKAGIAATEGAVAALYMAQSTDTPQSIADRFGVSLELFLAVNPEIGKLERVFPGQIVQIPLTPPTLPFITRVATEYVAQEGDTLYSIAQKFHIRLQALQKANPLIVAERMFAGQLLLLPTVEEGVPPLPAQLYVVQPEDTPAMVAGLFGFSVAALTAANPQRVNPNRLYAGELIVLPHAGGGDQQAGKPVFDRVRYIVQPMDSMEEVARQFEVWPYGISQLNAIVAPIPGLVLQLPRSTPSPAPPQTPPQAPAARPAPFGRRLELNDDDSARVAFPPNFSFPFYGRLHADGIWVNANGNITFNESDATYFPITDDFLEGPPRIAPFWTDLAPNAAIGTGGAYIEFFYDTQMAMSRMAVTWDRVPIYGTDSFYTIQLSLGENGDIAVHYFHIPPLPEGESQRVLVGVSPGRSAVDAYERSNVFVYNGRNNPRRAGEKGESGGLPSGSLNGRALLYRFNKQQGDYELIIM